MNTSTKQTENSAECGNKSKPLLSSRLFKFRAWGTKIKWLSKPFSFGQVLNFHDQIIKSLTTDEIVMQFTGLLDKNGKEIYEQDIVKWGMHGFSEECWHRYAIVEINPDIKFRIIFYINAKTKEKKESDNYEFHYGRFAYKDTQNHLEVIGNIFENPELL